MSGLAISRQLRICALGGPATAILRFSHVKGAWLIESHSNDGIRATTGRATAETGRDPEPTEAEVLVRLFASSVNPLDDFAITGYGQSANDRR